MNNKQNPFLGYFDKLFKEQGKKINPVHEIVNMYFVMNKLDNMPASFYKGRYSYGKLSKEAKQLYFACGSVLDDALWCLDKMRYKAEKGRFDWSIITCLKHDLL